MGRLIVMLVMLGFLGGCATEVGSKRWCDRMDNKSKSDWSTNEAKDYARHCLFK